MVPVITIDGPSGAGKGTVSILLANKLGWHFLDSGALYRVFALAFLKANYSLEDVSVLNILASTLNVEFICQGNNIEPFCKIILDGQDVTAQIRDEDCSQWASKLSVIPEVRAGLFVKQQSFRQKPGLVADGRDMGTVVFPDAILKIFLTASPKVRAQRRFLQLQAIGISVSLRDVFLALKRRDGRDVNRKIAPLKPATDAILIDTTKLGIDEVLNKVITALDNKLSTMGQLAKADV